MKKILFPLSFFVVLILLACSLYGPYLHNPMFFDDVGLTIDNQVIADNALNFGFFDRRWINNVSLGLTARVWGEAPEAYRVGSLILHVLVSFSLFVFIETLVGSTAKKDGPVVAGICAVLFLLHPVAAFAAGYIIERSIQLAALFSLWMWISVHRGVSRNQYGWLVLSCVAYYCAVFSKEHSVTALLVALLVAWHAAENDMRKMAMRIWAPLLMWCLIALTIVLSMRGVVGGAYEPMISEMGGAADDPGGAGFYFRSMINQAYLFFKYVTLWVLPLENWMSIDMREPFPSRWNEIPWVIGALSYLIYPVIVILLYRKTRITSTIVVGLLSPWLLFITQFSAVQYQESFVLYRSYLWALPAMLVPAMLLRKVEKRAQQYGVAIVIGALFFGLTWSRLQTFSSPYLLFDEAVQRLQGDDTLPGAYRVYENRGLAELHENFYDNALADFNKTILLNPSFIYAYKDRGYVFYKQKKYQLALDDFQKTIDLKPNYPKPYIGKGLTLIAMNRHEEGVAALAYACVKLEYGCPVYQANSRAH
jgi:protein O-mannosyl-transferase